jgi:NADP-dependent 3-hydroxy acid dehydrogenase YdfG
MTFFKTDNCCQKIVKKLSVWLLSVYIHIEQLDSRFAALKMNRLSRFFRFVGCLRQGNSMTAEQVAIIGKSFLITGGSSSIGEEVAITLASWGAHVIIACRSKPKGEALAETITLRDPNALVTILGDSDTFDLDSMRSLAERVLSIDEGDGLNGLILKAGISGRPYELSKQGYELHCATNVLEHHLLLRKLLPRIAESDTKI